MECNTADKDSNEIAGGDKGKSFVQILTYWLDLAIENFEFLTYWKILEILNLD